ncbi:MAG: protein translocase subunit SecD [Bdellovibrionales bacterium]|nr:protein translocase subunit SecD [Bdellovibrionales bacterium]
MIETLRGRLIVCLLVTLFGIVWVMPNVFDTSKIWWPTKEKLVYGLDLQGGLHLALGVDIPAALKEQSRRVGNSLKDGLKQDHSIDAAVETVNSEVVHLKILFSGDQKKVEDYLDRYHRNELQVIKAAADSIEVQYYDAYLIQFKKNLIEKARQVIANRIDEFGVAEPNIAVQGDDRILVQLPGLKDTESAKNLINRTAKLEFMIVSEDAKLEDVQTWIDQAEKEGNFALGKDDLRYSAYLEKINEAIKDKLPKNTVVRFIKAPNAKNLEAGKLPYVLRTDAMVGGDTLSDAYTTFSQETNSPEVAFRFADKGAREFGALTTEYVRKLMAIVLDGVVQSAPVINSPIVNGSGVIQLGQTRDYQETLNEANLLSMVLKSGALPVSLQQLEERAVGPSLGKDSIDKGKMATLIGSGLVILFMFVYYGMFGLVANIAIVLNIILLFAILSSLRATLTLPGIAGIALTVGMAVDANIIIFEKIRDEMNKGASLLASIREGFDRAFWTIFDANVTTAGTCVVLMYYGTGPIRGFAVSLLIGLTVSMFTSIFLSRALLDLFTVKFKWNVKL